MKKYKTFYSVKYAIWGADSPSFAWFASKKEAEKFYKSRDHVDRPVPHRALLESTIKKYESLC